MRRVTGVLLGYVVLGVLALPGLGGSAQDAPQSPPPAQTVPLQLPLPENVAQPAPPPAAPAPPAAAPAPPAPPAEEPAVSAQAAEPVAAQAKKPASRKRRGRADEVAAAASTTVAITDFDFSPATISISVGDTVTWRNDGPTPHTATASDGSFDTGILRRGRSGSHTFDSPGTFAYICTPHPNMKGTVRVAGASTGGDDDAGDEDTGDGATAGDSADSGSAGTGTTTAGDSADGDQLAATGSDAWFLALVGIAMLGLGLALRRGSARATG